MVINSLKQLFRRPGMALIFFLLLTAVTALLTFAAVTMAETNQRISAAEGQFTTIATVSQNTYPGDEYLHAEILDFQGAAYVHPPETRPHLLAYNQELHTTVEQYSADGIHVVTFTALEDCTALDQQIPIRIEEALYNKFDTTAANVMGYGESELLPGDQVLFTQTLDLTPLEAGKTYIASLWFMAGQENGWAIAEDGYYTDFGPFSTQYDSNGNPLEGAGRAGRVEEVTSGFWDKGGRGRLWTNWVEALKWEKHTSPLPVVPTNSLSLLPSFHRKQAYISHGREITPEEFASGAKVCVMPRALMLRNLLSIGDKIRLPLRVALCGFVPNGLTNMFHFNLSYCFTPLNAEGELYDVFWEDEYEIVGEYQELQEGYSELYYDIIIVPEKSIGTAWENNIAYYGPMNPQSTSFQIENGSIPHFNTALHKAVPQASKLEIIYDDNGYEEVMQGLKNARLSSMLLLAVGALSALTVLVLLLYFFVIKERKRTAIERSLGLTKTQCRVSLVSGILLLAIPAVVLGSGASWIISNGNFADEKNSTGESGFNFESTIGEDLRASDPAESMETAYFSRDFSLWAENENTGMDIMLDDTALSVQGMIYFAVPGVIFLCVLMLSILLVNFNLRLEPILLLGGSEE